MNDSIYLCCNSLRYETVVYNSNLGNTTQGRLNQVLVSIPLFVDSMSYEYKIMEILQYLETAAWPYGKNTTFTFVDENGILMTSQQGITFTMTLKVKPFTSEEITQ